MKLFLSGNSLVRDIKKQFSRYFPFLKLELFYPSNEQSKTEKEVWVEDDKPIKELCNNLLTDGIEFDSTISVEEFEEKIETMIGVPAKVFRSFGDAWLQSFRSNISLQQQNVTSATSIGKFRYNVNTLFL
jgi:hypothetical protein